MVWTRVNLPPEINHKLKLLAAKNNTSMVKLIKKLIIDYVEENYPSEIQPILFPTKKAINIPEIKSEKVKQLAKELGLKV